MSKAENILKLTSEAGLVNESTLWKQHTYGQGKTAVFGGVLRLTVKYDGLRAKGSTELPFTVSLADLTLRERFSNEDEATKAAIEFAERIVKKIVDDLKKLK